MTQHVYPKYDKREHVLGVECWCKPHLLNNCDECEHGCAVCKDGMVMAPCDSQPDLVLHHQDGDPASDLGPWMVDGPAPVAS